MPLIAPERFRELLAARNVALPVAPSPDPDGAGVLIDDHGNDLLVVDPNGWRNDADVRAIAAWVAYALNAAGGYEPAAVVPAPGSSLKGTRE